MRISDYQHDIPIEERSIRHIVITIIYGKAKVEINLVLAFVQMKLFYNSTMRNNVNCTSYRIVYVIKRPIPLITL